MKHIKRISIIFFLIYAPCLHSVFKFVQPETLDALELYEQPEIEDVSENPEEDQSALEDGEETISSVHPIVEFENDPEQLFVDKKEVQARINECEILDFTLDEILARAKEYPGYYGDSDEEEITSWYEQAQQNVGHQKEVLDRIKNDAKKHSLERILENARNNPLYKGLFPYQRIVDAYYEMNPAKIQDAEKQFYKGIQFLHIDEEDNSLMCEKDVQKFLMEYRKLPTLLQQSVMVKTLYGDPYLGGAYMKSAKIIVDWIMAHQSENSEWKKAISLLQS